MQVQALAIPQVKLLVPQVFRDERGFFTESYSARTFADAAGVTATFVQDNHSLSVAKGVVRGLHFQSTPDAQDKLVRVLRGSIFDVAVDIRVGSPTFGRHVTAILSAENANQVWVPKGFAHGFCTLEPDTEVFYKTTAYYAPASDKGLRWNDPALAIAWPVTADAAILSAKDTSQLLLSELPEYFRYGDAS